MNFLLRIGCFILAAGYGLSLEARMFSEATPLKFKIKYNEAQLQELKKIASSQSDREQMAAQIEWKGVQIPIQMSVKGMSSPAELDFPKLKIEIDSGASKDSALLAGTPFETDLEFSMQTHGYHKDLQNEWTRLGRLRNSVWVFREAAIYKLFAEMGIPVRGVRHGNVSYETENGIVKDKPALLQEKMSKFAKRLKAKKVKNLPFLYVEDASVPQEIQLRNDVKSGKLVFSEIAFVGLANILIGNADFDFPTLIDPSLSVQNFNILKIAETSVPGGEKIILSPEDFDMASSVTGDYRVDPNCEIPSAIRYLASPIHEKVWCQIDLLCISHHPSDIQEALNRILLMEPKATSFRDSMVDPEGQQILQKQIRTFYSVAKKIKVSGELEAICQYQP